jgi:hypothetical protein
VRYTDTHRHCTLLSRQVPEDGLRQGGVTSGCCADDQLLPQALTQQLQVPHTVRQSVEPLALNGDGGRLGPHRSLQGPAAGTGGTA